LNLAHLIGATLLDNTGGRVNLDPVYLVELPVVAMPPIVYW